MTKIFWVIVAIDAVFFIVLLVVGLTAPAPRDGTREMGLAFGVIIPGVFVALAVAAYVLSNSRAVRVIALATVAAPLVLIAGARLRSAWIDYQICHASAGEGRIR